MAVNGSEPAVPEACKASAPICKEGGSGMFLPLSESEMDMDPALRAVIYGVVMVYFFVGVAIIADTFVASIEEITSRWKQTKKEGKLRTGKVWNDTVATLTLMALGSSAPEIFLSVIDVLKKEFHAAQLGPSTIVGSASFNLLVIVAACIFVIPSHEERVIKELPAFYITAFFSLAAYLWATFILVAHTEDQVDPWEAIVTFLFLPIMVWVSYKTDVGAFDCILVRIGIIKPEKADTVSTTLHGRRPSEFVKEVRSSMAPPLQAADISRAVEIAKRKVAVVGFKEETMVVNLTAEDQTVKIPVVIAGHRDKEVLIQYKSFRFTAVPGFEYESVNGFISFFQDESEKFIELTVNKWSGNKASSKLLIILQDAEGADFHPDTDGGDQCAILTVTIQAAASPASCRRLCGMLLDIDGLYLGFSDWKEQCLNAFYAGGSREDHAEASALDLALHFAALPWKIIFMIVPPPSFFGGWLCFVGSLMGIALLTSFVSDLAELFGCVLELGDVVTAITFVALGTSMPDLFASLSAAKEDATADASVVNVTGSNSVNVFLGLGVPWTICAIYWASKERTAQWEICYPAAAARLNAAGETTSMVFVVEAGYIGFSVITFCCCCLAALSVIVVRRKYLLAELGGPFVPKLISSMLLVLLWAAWIAIVVWKVLRDPDVSAVEQVVACAGFAFVVVCGTLVTLAVIFSYRVPAAAREVSRRFSATSSRSSGDGFSLEMPRSFEAKDSDQKAIPSPCHSSSSNNFTTANGMVSSSLGDMEPPSTTHAI